MFYKTLEKDGYCVYTFNCDGIDLKIKSVDNEGDDYVYINYNGSNPLSHMLWGNFAEECEFLCSIKFEVEKENFTENSTMYAIVNNDDLINFIKEIIFFIMENKNVLDQLITTKDKNIWSF